MAMPNDIERVAKYLSNPLWRINNLYYVVDKEGQKCPFRLNSAQDELYRNMHYLNIVLKARQLGVSTFVCILFLDRCLFNSNVSAGIIAHTLEDGQQLFRRVKFAYDSLPEDIKQHITADNDTSQMLKFSNGSSLRVGTSLRSSTFQYLHISEFGKLCSKTPDKAREIVTGALNTLAPGQYCFIESTAEGREGYFYDMCKKAQDIKDSRKALTKLDFKFHFYSWFEHPEYRLSSEGVVIPSELHRYFDSIETKTRCTIDHEQRAWYAKKLESQREDMRREFPSVPEEAFESSSDGNYYSSYITKARQEGRITKLFYDPKKLVHSAWDLGYSDSSAIWLFQVEGQRINVLEYYENSGEALPHYIQWLKSKPYIYGKHLVPHDAAQTEFGSGLTRTAIARGLGVNFSQTPNLKVIEGIDAVRNLLHRCYFDEEKCAKGITMLDAYRKEWNDQNGCWRDRPLHNFASHGSDAFRMLACGISLTSDRGSVESDHKAVAAYFSR